MRAPVVLGGMLAACVGVTTPVYHPDIVAVVDSDSDKAVQIVSDERLAAHEPRAVPATAVASALLASGMFLDDDARALAVPVASHLATMTDDQAVRIVGWAEDAPRYYYVYVHGGRIRITYYAGSQHADDYSGVIPTEAQAIVAPVAAPSAPPIEPAPIAPTPTPAPIAPTPADPIAQAKPSPRPRRAHAATATYPSITEAEARKEMRELDDALRAGLITANEHRGKRKDILARL